MHYSAQIAAIALLGHTNYELSLCRQDAIKPNLNIEIWLAVFFSNTSHNLTIWWQASVTAYCDSSIKSHQPHSCSQIFHQTSIPPETEPAIFRQGPFPVQVETTENLEEKGGNQLKINTADDIMSKLHILQVTQFEDVIPTLIAYLVAQTSCFKSGRLEKFTHCWQKIISHTEILQMLSGQYIGLSAIATKDQAGSADRGQPIPTKFSAFFLYQLRLRSLVFLVK